MLTAVSVVPPVGAFWPALTIPVQQPNADPGVFAEKIDGLEPVAAEISTNSYNQLDGDFYVGSRVPKRNIVLHLVMETGRDNSVSDIRRNLYGYFMPKMNITLQFDFTDRASVQIDGYVESWDSDRWSNDPDAAISIVCPKPNFRATSPTTVTGYSIYGDDPTVHDVLNIGDRMVGFEMGISNPITNDTDFSGSIHIERMIEGSTPGEYFSIQKLYLDNTIGNIYLPQGIFRTVYVNTKQGEKTAEIRQDFEDGAGEVMTDNLLGNMTEDSGWPVLWSAMHKVRVITTDTDGWADAAYALQWWLKFTPEWGAI